MPRAEPRRASLRFPTDISYLTEHLRCCPYRLLRSISNGVCMSIEDTTAAMVAKGWPQDGALAFAELQVMMDAGMFKEGGLCFTGLMVPKDQRTPEAVAAYEKVISLKDRIKAAGPPVPKVA